MDKTSKGFRSTYSSPTGLHVFGLGIGLPGDIRGFYHMYSAWLIPLLLIALLYSFSQLSVFDRAIPYFYNSSFRPLHKLRFGYLWYQTHFGDKLCYCFVPDTIKIAFLKDSIAPRITCPPMVIVASLPTSRYFTGHGKIHSEFPWRLSNVAQRFGPFGWFYVFELEGCIQSL